MLLIGLAIGGIVVICITYFVHNWSWRNPKSNGKVVLVPGSMGWPLLGESLQFFAPNTTSDLSHFFKKRMDKYGPIFRTNLVGKPMIVSTDPNFNYFIFQKGELFKSFYPDTIDEIIGKQHIGNLHGSVYKDLKNMVLSVFGPESLKKMLPEVEKAANQSLERWSSLPTVEIKEASAKMIFDLTAKKLIGYGSEKPLENIRENYEAFIRGLLSFPLNIPGTTYNKCLQGRKKVMKTLKKLLQERRANPRKQQTDFFDYVIQELEKEDTVLTEAIALDLMFLLLFASFETTSEAITIAFKFLEDHPMLLKQLTKEHEEIIRKGENRSSTLTWNEYKSMTFTFQFINETTRLANIAPILFRKALKDVEFNGYTIPTGSMIMVCLSAVHLNPDLYKDPLEFNPSRWEGIESHSGSKSFMAFGGGMRLCVGVDFAKVQMAVFLHCLVTKYKWQFIQGGDIVRAPGLQFPNGLHIKISEKET